MVLLIGLENRPQLVSCDCAVPLEHKLVLGGVEPSGGDTVNSVGCWSECDSAKKPPWLLSCGALTDGKSREVSDPSLGISYIRRSVLLVMIVKTTRCKVMAFPVYMYYMLCTFNTAYVI